MTKGLKAFNELKEGHWFDFADTYFSLNPKLKMDLDIIENALKREDSIEITAIDIEQDNKELYKENKKLKRALEIIKEKGIVVQFIKETNLVEQYNAGISGYLLEPLTKEEYDILKEVLL